MNYKELLEKYKAGTATPEERAAIERDLEKYESINEYLADGLIDSPSQPSGAVKKDAAFAGRVRKNIFKRFILTAAITVAIVAAGVLATFYIISPLIDKEGYQPIQSRNEEQYGKTKLMIDLAVFSELHFPGIITNSTSSLPLGFGQYDVEFTQWDVFKSTFEQYTCRIENNRFKNLTSSFYHQFPAVNTFKHGIYMTNDLWEEGDAPALDELRKLPETAYVKAYVSFKEDIPIDDALHFRERFHNLYFIWIAVRCCEKNRQQLPQIGFEPTGAGTVIQEGPVDQEEYPYLELAWADKLLENKDIITHFTSLLKYMSDNMDFIKLMDAGVVPDDIYPKSLDYIEKNGIQSYGVLVMGRAKELLALRESPEVDGLMIDNVKISVYSR